MASVSALPLEGTGELASVPSCTPASYRPLFSEIPDVVNHCGAFPPSRHGVQHHIITSGMQVTLRFQRLDTAKSEAAKKKFKQMEADDNSQRSSSCLASLLHTVCKSDGSWRSCGYYSCLNLTTRPDRYLMPNMMNLASCLYRCKVFTNLDLKRSYCQILVRPEDIQKTAIITPFGLWEFLCMAFGLHHAGQTFQKLMDMVGASLTFVFIYLYDVLVANPDDASHVEHLKLVF
jgi:hypothetical protein